MVFGKLKRRVGWIAFGALFPERPPFAMADAAATEAAEAQECRNMITVASERYLPKMGVFHSDRQLDGFLWRSCGVLNGFQCGPR